MWFIPAEKAHDACKEKTHDGDCLRYEQEGVSTSA